MEKLLARVNSASNDPSREVSDLVPGDRVTKETAWGIIGAEIFTATEQTEHGGVMLRLTVKDLSGARTPVCKPLPDGMEIHLPGHDEAYTMLEAIATLIASLNIQD
jgi:hypothetical protein